MCRAQRARVITLCCRPQGQGESRALELVSGSSARHRLCRAQRARAITLCVVVAIPSHIWCDSLHVWGNFVWGTLNNGQRPDKPLIEVYIDHTYAEHTITTTHATSRVTRPAPVLRGPAPQTLATWNRSERGQQLTGITGRPARHECDVLRQQGARAAAPRGASAPSRARPAPHRPRRPPRPLAACSRATTA